MRAWSLVLAIPLLLVLAACSDDRPLDVRKAEEAWETYLDRPNQGTYELFLKHNRTAAFHHGNSDDATGIRYQARALEVQSREAVRREDAELARLVRERVDELEEDGTLEIYDEELPGAGERFLEARARLGGLAE